MHDATHGNRMMSPMFLLDTCMAFIGSFVKFDLKLLSLLIGDATLNICHIRDAELAPWHCHPRLPSVVAWSAQWMVAVAVACPDTDASTREGFHRAEADVCFFASVLA